MHKERCLLYAAGEMSPREAAEFQEHLASCPGCRDWLNVVSQGAAWARQAEQAPPQTLVASASAPPAGGGAWPWLAVALAAGVAGGGLYLTQRHERAPQETPVLSLEKPETTVQVPKPAEPEPARAPGRQGVSCRKADAERLLEDARRTRDELRAGLKDVLRGVREDLQRLREDEEERSAAVAGKSYDCEECHSLNACLRMGKADVDSIVGELEQELSLLHESPLDAIDIEVDITERRFEKLSKDHEASGPCTRGIRDRDTLVDFESFMAAEASLQEDLRSRLDLSWCERHPCPKTDISGLAARARAFGLSAEFEKAQAFLAAPEGNESRDFIKGIRALAGAVEALERSRSECGE